ncbi:MAG: RNA 2',3'-cyclic phosphodiesterase [Propionibacteriaceae bacterium]|nr:RNA 2',3'-cyclic phosphodiesterase [Propionibacteriaceae bacterium]
MGSRLFSAVLPPPEVVDEIDGFLAPRRGSDDRLRWAPPIGWHLTTSFMASVEASHIDDLSARLTDAAARTRPFRVRVAGTRCFPGVWRARVLALDVAAGGAELGALARRCRNAANRAGVAVDGAPFTGHLTLARARRPIEATKWLRVLDSFPGTEWLASEVVLVESHLSDPGRRYEVVSRYPFLGDGTGS